MSNLWDRFDNVVSAEEVVEAKSKFDPIDAGKYVARLEKIEAKTAQSSGLPMLATQFRTEENRVIFYNIMLQNINFPQMTAVNVANAVTLISNITGDEIEYEGLSKLADYIADIEVGGVYNIEVSYGKKDLERSFPKVKVIDAVISDDELPFN